MEEESFEDEEIARVMNEYYVAIKVDREERPDLDAAYMAAVRRLTGGGGWPMTVWLTADRKPFFGGTYFPARDGERGIGTGFLTLLKRLHAEYAANPKQFAEASEKLTRALQDTLLAAPAHRPLNTPTLNSATRRFAALFDAKNGGMTGAPKFPSDMPVRFLLRQHHRTGDEQALRMATATLEKMAAGGIHDHVGGGFHRYSTDDRWRVPHFEKMLYDNARLAVSYLEGYQAAGREDFAAVARDILRYVERELTSPEGAFFAAADADSLTPSGRREEGWFFTWTPAETSAVLGRETARRVNAFYDVVPNGPLEGRSVLAARPLDEVARKLRVARSDLQTTVDDARERLYTARSQRPAPLRDEKVVTAWNGLMISAFARAALTLGDESYAKSAARAGLFLLGRSKKDGRLSRSYTAGKAGPAAYLPDYAFFIAGLLDLHEATGELHWLSEAVSLDRVLESSFEDKVAGGYFLTAAEEEAPLARRKPDEDGAEPSGNSVHALNLMRLHLLTDQHAYRERAEKTLRAFSGTLTEAPERLGEMLMAADFLMGTPKEVVIVTPGSRTEAEPFLRQLRPSFLPNRVLIIAVEGNDFAEQAKVIPLFKDKKARGGRATAYVCEKQTCKLPTADPEVFARQIAPPAQQRERLHGRVNAVGGTLEAR